ncbi:WbuC family cupin fold metalloprotein [Erwinia psidii]|uniref:Cupin fold metalloprotein, WbuC family n=1 Tax=Erwinia psidii TaxID=69224 RepID=A0A3N6TNI6_9GAMM|nr:WbuC family cupin fold metalloprotein [Erwinia psidii]MCX8958988.1 cupin fold metalloprotein, WbuC family [Erwinia psidii]MCX8962812.1 cupin fold metalloprotein, WbuC family [Erwinia psidii]MCX8966130.1 cupin fold metalloprotein, WbuC family [Erwinia psidii]RQM36782.1 cupin fold metalloprotein, WbuC family [Erwinia psidii]
MKQISRSDLSSMSQQAASVARLRSHRTLHEELSDPVQRLAIAMEPGTYIRPHRHPQTWELLTPLKGRFVVLQFNDAGEVTDRTVLGEDILLQEMPAFTWHAVLSLDEGGVIFEVKHGPYQALTEDDCMHWAPAEGGEGTTEVMAWYAGAQPGDRFSR